MALLQWLAREPGMAGAFLDSVALCVDFQPTLFTNDDMDDLSLLQNSPWKAALFRASCTVKSTNRSRRVGKIDFLWG
jgi:hypothetical protein